MENTFDETLNNSLAQAENSLATFSTEITRSLAQTMQRTQGDLSDFSQSLRQTLSRTIENSLNGLGRSIMQQTVYKPLQQAVSSPLQGMLSSVFGGFRANGGAVGNSQAYMVGEKGAELFIPRQAGTIVPMATAAAKNTGTPVHITINTPDPHSFWQSRSQIQTAVASAVRQGNRFI